MSSKKEAILLIAGLLISFGCRKEGSTGPRVWEGRVLEYGSDKPIAGAWVYLWEGSSEWWGLPDRLYGECG